MENNYIHKCNLKGGKTMFNILTIVPNYGEYIIIHQVIIILSLLIFAFIILLRSSVMIIIQLSYLFCAIIIEQTQLLLVINTFILLQIILTLFIMYKMKYAIDRNYLLIMEKTHAIRRDITKNRSEEHT